MSEEALFLNNTSLTFGHNLILRKVSLCIFRGEIVSLMGPSGCGKTTLLRVVAGLAEAKEGEGRLFGQTVFRNTTLHYTRDIRNRIGIVFQGGALFDSLSVEQNVAFPLRHCFHQHWKEQEIAERVRIMLEQVGLAGTGERLPEELSGGMRKRVALARSLVHRPDFLLLDEPTTGLDPVTARQVDALIVKLAETYGTTVLSVTHDVVSALGISDRMLLMAEGRMLWEGTGEEWELSSNRHVRSFKRGVEPVVGGDPLES
ncbi:MAG: ATP-binding cassette domain-containing protein [Synergistales bacterium]|nr:ATP-binding cassette domain-containing protein [Synergistales bacterium]